jgi:hypothetical protein
VIGGTVDIRNSFNLYSLLYAKDSVASTSTDLDGSSLRIDRSVHPRSSRLVSTSVIRMISQARENLSLTRLWAPLRRRGTEAALLCSGAEEKIRSTEVTVAMNFTSWRCLEIGCTGGCRHLSV